MAGAQKQKLEEKFVAFSKGPRSCIGREIAMLMLEKAVVGVLEKWERVSERIKPARNAVYGVRD